jgi:hypothetical protein
LGPNDPTTLSSLQILATTVWDIDELDESTVMYQNLLDERLRLFGEITQTAEDESITGPHSAGS